MQTIIARCHVLPAKGHTSTERSDRKSDATLTIQIHQIVKDLSAAFQPVANRQFREPWP
jgi:hypothetical protein